MKKALSTEGFALGYHFLEFCYHGDEGLILIGLISGLV